VTNFNGAINQEGVINFKTHDNLGRCGWSKRYDKLEDKLYSVDDLPATFQFMIFTMSW